MNTYRFIVSRKVVKRVLVTQTADVSFEAESLQAAEATFAEFVKADVDGTSDSCESLWSDDEFDNIDNEPVIEIVEQSTETTIEEIL